MLIAKLLIDLYLMVLPKRGQNAATGVVRLDAIGDFVVWLPAAEVLVADLRARNRRVVLIANQLWAPWAKALLTPDETVSVDMGRFGSDLRYRLSVLKRVRALKLGEIILPTYSRIPGDGNDAIAFASGARNRIGNLGYRSRNLIAGILRALLNFGYSSVVPSDSAPRAGRPISETENNAVFLRGLGLSATARVGRLPFAVDVDLASLCLPDSPYAVLIPGGSFSAKAWPVERFAEVGHALKASGLELLISGSSGEHELCEQLAAACGGRNIAGQTSLPALGEVIRRARLLVGNDSAGMHIAVAAGTDSLCVMWGALAVSFPMCRNCYPRASLLVPYITAWTALAVLVPARYLRCRASYLALPPFRFRQFCYPLKKFCATTVPPQSRA